MRYAVELPRSASKEELRAWCTETFGPSVSLLDSRWVMLEWTIQFKQEKDRNWFILRWSK